MFPWCNGENVTVEMHGTTLVFRLRKDLCHGVAHAEALVSDNEFYAVKSAFFEPYKEAFPAFGILLHALRRADDLSATVLVYADGDQNANIFKLSAPVALEVNSIHIDIRVLPGQLAVAPFLNVDVGFLIQITDGRCRHSAAPQGFRYVLHPLLRSRDRSVD